MSARFSLLLEACMVSLQPLELCGLPPQDFAPAYPDLETLLRYSEETTDFASLQMNQE